MLRVQRGTRSHIPDLFFDSSLVKFLSGTLRQIKKKMLDSGINTLEINHSFFLFSNFCQLSGLNE